MTFIWCECNSLIFFSSTDKKIFDRLYNRTFPSSQLKRSLQWLFLILNVWLLRLKWSWQTNDLSIAFFIFLFCVWVQEIYDPKNVQLQSREELSSEEKKKLHRKKKRILKVQEIFRFFCWDFLFYPFVSLSFLFRSYNEIYFGSASKTTKGIRKEKKRKIESSSREISLNGSETNQRIRIKSTYTTLSHTFHIPFSQYVVMIVVEWTEHNNSHANRHNKLFTKFRGVCQITKRNHCRVSQDKQVSISFVKTKITFFKCIKTLRVVLKSNTTVCNQWDFQMIPSTNVNRVFECCEKEKFNSFVK